MGQPSKVPRLRFIRLNSIILEPLKVNPAAKFGADDVFFAEPLEPGRITGTHWRSPGLGKKRRGK